jgi:hypothetical protein
LPDGACAAASMRPDLAHARRSGAHALLVYGGIRKMSTLVQWGEVQVSISRQRNIPRRY